MEPERAGWRSTTWARWVGWTVVYGLVLVAAWKVMGWLPASPGFVVVQIGVWVIAAVLIGVRFGSKWWMAGPPLAALVLITATILWWAYLGPQVPFQTAFGMVTPRENLENPFTLIVLVVGLPQGCALLAIPAWAGVWWGRRRAGAVALQSEHR